MDLPTIKVKQKDLKGKIKLPVKNEILYKVRILSIEGIKPVKVKIAGKKSVKIPISINLDDMITISEERIKKIQEENPKETINYMKIKNFGIDKTCIWQLAPTHYEVLKMWISSNNIEIGTPFFFNRIGFGVNSKLIFRTQKEAENFIKNIREKEVKK